MTSTIWTLKGNQINFNYDNVYKITNTKRKIMRYFLVHYVARTVDNLQMVGLSEVVTGENFINRKKFIQEVMDNSLEKGVALSEVMPTQILELNESDYMDWYE